MGEIKVHGKDNSSISKRVEIALKMKGVEYEFVEEDLQSKSQELLNLNPIHKKIPVFVHDGKPIVESLIILEYIDETWKGNSLLPSDPYERAQARFWAKYIDDNISKLLPGVATVEKNQGQIKSKEEQEEESHEVLKWLEVEIRGKNYMGGKEMGYLDLAGLVIAYWMPILQQVSGKQLLSKDKFPAICDWAHRLLGYDPVKDCLPDPENLAKAFATHFARK